MKKYPSQADLISWFSYDEGTGTLLWQERHDIVDLVDCAQWNMKFAGREAGCINSRGYRVVTIFGITYYVHRIIWKMVYGRDPQQLLDHINGFADDNRLNNIREATHAQNAHNRKRIRHKKSGLPKGVVLNKQGKYQVSVRKNNYIGQYDTIEEAAKVYAEHARQEFGEYARTE